MSCSGAPSHNENRADYWPLVSVVSMGTFLSSSKRKGMKGMQFGQLTTVNGYLMSECTSAMQKCIRRGLEEEALFWATELDLAGYGGYVWKRLRIIASEDIGLADSNVCVQVRALYDNWVEQRKKNKEDRSLAERLFLIHAILICVRARKSRMVDTSLIVMYEGVRPLMKVPDFALDMHTIRGRKSGRGVDHFFDDGAIIKNADSSLLPDRYFNRAREARRKARYGYDEQMGLVE
jgi:replication-associated recombination protein RarA